MAEELDVESWQDHGEDPELAQGGQGDEREGGQEPTDRCQDQELGVSIVFLMMLLSLLLTSCLDTYN